MFVPFFLAYIIIPSLPIYKAFIIYLSSFNLIINNCSTINIKPSQKHATISAISH